MYPWLAALAIVMLVFSFDTSVSEAGFSAHRHGMTVAFLLALAGFACRAVSDNVLPGPAPATADGRHMVRDAQRVHKARRPRSPYPTAVTASAAAAGGGVALALALDGAGALHDAPLCDLLTQCGVGSDPTDSTSWMSDVIGALDSGSGPGRWRLGLRQFGLGRLRRLRGQQQRQRIELRQQ
ncbi:hypothetical protein [Streptomyces sp. URMC 124]|uniref:hypothetical protein n=1 Tax=Streptomyces sp. URMC 124 TaxID=3423405 RepID=UPI003F1ABE8F